MRVLLWTLSLTGLLLWSLLAWAAAGLLGVAEAWAPGIGGDPFGLGAFAANWADFLGLAVKSAIGIAWAVVAAVLLAGTVLLSRTLGAIGGLARGRSGGGQYQASTRLLRPARR